MTSGNPYFLSKGSHLTAAAGRCAMEWAAWLAGEPHSDAPRSVSPVLRSFCTAFNDRLDDDQRQRLRPYLARTIGTADDGLDPKRLQICREWLVREAIPSWLDLAGRQEIAQQLRALPEALTEENTLRLISKARDEALEARSAARERLMAKVRDDAKDRMADAADAAHAAAAYDAACDADAACAAARDAAAYDAAYDAYAAAPLIRGAVYGAVRALTTERLKPIRDQHIEGGFQLLDRMLPKVMIDLPVEVEQRVTELEAAGT